MAVSFFMEKGFGVLVRSFGFLMGVLESYIYLHKWGCLLKSVEGSKIRVMSNYASVIGVPATAI